MNPTRNKHSFVRFLGGSVVTIGLGLGHFVDHRLFLIALFGSLNLLQSSITGFCPPHELYEEYIE